MAKVGSSVGDLDAVVSRSRRTALGLAGLALLVGVAVKATLGRVATDYRFLHTLVAAATLVPVAILVAVHWLMFRSAGRNPPADFQLGRWRKSAAFYAPTPPGRHAVAIVWLGYWGVAAVAALPGQDSLLNSGWGRAASIGGPLVCLAVSVWLLYRRPYVTLSPDGLIVRQLFGSTVLGWDAFAPAVAAPQPVSPGARMDWLWIPVKATASFYTAVSATPVTDPTTGYRRFPLRLRAVCIDPVFLAYALEYYRLGPAARGAIGTPGGRQVLDDAFRAAR